MDFVALEHGVCWKHAQLIRMALDLLAYLFLSLLLPRSFLLVMNYLVLELEPVEVY